LERWENEDPLPPFSKVFILKIDKVLCFDALLEVFILKVVSAVFVSAFAGVDSKEVGAAAAGSDREREVWAGFDSRYTN
jgi:hypothetical protein